MNPLLWIALLGGGLYLFTRKGEAAAPGAAVPPVDGKSNGELLTVEGIKDKFLSNMNVFKAAFEAENKTAFLNQGEALKNLEGDDDRARAVAMAEFAKTSAEAREEKKNTLSDAAMALALNYRDMFARSNRAAKADKLIEETLTFVKNKPDPAKARPLDKAFSDLVVDSPMMAVIGAPVSSVDMNPLGVMTLAPKTSADNDYSASFFEVEAMKEGQSVPGTKPAGVAMVSANADYQLDSYAMAGEGGTKILAYIGKVKEGSEPKFGKYVLTFAPAPKAG